MAKISELSDGGSLLPTDYLLAVRSGANVKVQADTINVDQIDLGDDERIRLGASQDLQIYHDSATSTNKIIGSFDVTGTVTADGLTVDGTDTISFVATSGTADVFDATDSTALKLSASLEGQSNSKIVIATDASRNQYLWSGYVNTDLIFGKRKLVSGSNRNTAALKIESTGNISFYEDTGSTAKLYWDASAESLCINNYNSTARLVVGGVRNDATIELLQLESASDWANGDALGSLVFRTADPSGAGSGIKGSIRYGTAGGTGADTYMAFNTAGTTSGTNDTERMRIDSSGNVGIGTTNPISEIHVVDAAASAGLRLESSDTGNSFIAFDDQSASNRSRIYYNHSTDSLQLTVAGDSEAMRIDSSGNVGIGTSSPSRQLTIQSSGAQMSLLSDTTGSSVLNMGDTADDNIGRIQYDNANDKMVFRVNASDAVTIDSSGNVGIGTTSPTEPLTVSETASGSTTQIVSLVNPVGAASTGVRLWMSGTNTTTRGTFIDAVAESTSNNHSLRFGTSASSAAPTERMRIDSSGNLLVGKTTTSSALTTAGVDLRPEGRSFMTRSAGPALYLSRTSFDGNIAEFYKDGTTVGSIGSVAGQDIVIGSGSAGLRFLSSGPAIQPRNADGTANNDAIDIGLSGNRFKDLYLSGGVYLGGTGAQNKLDDYEEGTWTPTVFGQTTAGSYTLTDDGSTYTKVGRQVTVIGKLRDITQSSAGSGNLNIGGLPFAVDQTGQGSLRFNTLDVANDTVNFVVENLSVGSAMFISESKDNATAGVTAITAITSGTTDIFFTLTYFV